MDLKGKVGLVTGSASGIGRATLLGLAKAGANVVVCDLRAGADAEKVVAEAKALGVQAIFAQADVSNDASITAAINRAKDEFGSLDVLVNNAGTTVFVPHADLDALTDEMWQRVMNVNLMGVFYGCRAAARIMRAQKSGCIVSVSSAAGVKGGGSSLPYSVSKAAVISLTQLLAKALAPDIRVNAVCPGVVDTHWHDGHEQNKTNFARSTPMGRVSTPEDIAEVIVALCTNAGFVTGQYIMVDGGDTMF